MVRIKNLKMAFIEPDLGTGDREHLIIDVANALADQGVQILFVTNRFDKKRTVVELKQNKYLVRTVCDWIPRSICGQFQALLAYVRMVFLSLIYLLFLRHIDKPDIYFVDQIPLAVPLIKLFKGKVIYYAHQPDFLARSHYSKLKHIYRLPIDWLKMYFTSMSDVMLVNSEYTAEILMDTFRSINKELRVLYPTISASYQEALKNVKPDKSIKDLLPEIRSNDCTVFLSMNEFHPAKNLELAIDALEQMKGRLSESDWKKVYLILAGECDARSHINAKYFSKLVKLVERKDLNTNVIFLKSPSGTFKAELIANSNCLLYTPINEHFSLVPLEAMAAGKPVIACNSGGPSETVDNNVTGYLCDPVPEEMANVMHKLFNSRATSIVLGENGKKRLGTEFSRKKFCENVMDIVLRGLGYTVIDSSSFSTNKSSLGVVDNKEKRKSFEMRANITIMPEIFEDNEDEHEAIPESLNKKTEKPKDSHRQAAETCAAEEEPNKEEDLNEKENINEEENFNKEVDLNEEGNLKREESLNQEGNLNNDENLNKEEDFNEEEFKKDESTEDSIENLEEPNVDEDQSNVVPEILIDSPEENKRLLKSIEATEKFIDSEVQHSKFSTPIKFPIRRYPASLSLDVDANSSYEAMEITETSTEIETDV